jgi:hypothetical protein
LNENTGQDTGHVGSQENGASDLTGMSHDLIMATAYIHVIRVIGFVNGGIVF